MDAEQWSLLCLTLIDRRGLAEQSVLLVATVPPFH
jgi:hypothetical protein